MSILIETPMRKRIWTASVAALPLALLLAGCAPQVTRPLPETTAGSLPSVLLRSSQMAAQAQQKVAEVLFVQSHPPVMAIAPSHQKALSDRFNFHWEGNLYAVALNLSSAMGWGLQVDNPKPVVEPYVYVDEHNVTAQVMVNAINKEAMPTAMLVLDPQNRTIILKKAVRVLPMQVVKSTKPLQVTKPVKIAVPEFHTPRKWFESAKEQLTQHTSS